MKIKRTGKGNIKLVITEEQAMAIRYLIGKSNKVSRGKMLREFNYNWTDLQDIYLLDVHNLLNKEIE
jgi:hypothetical protein